MKGGVFMFDSERRFPVSLPDISPITSLFADKTRAAICGALMSGTAWTVGELANFAHVSKSNATEQINKLVEGGIVKEQRQGRHRYLMLSSLEVATLIETLAQASEVTLRSPQSLNGNRANYHFRKGRTCYNHLAGELGIRLLHQLQMNEYLTDDCQLTNKGIELLNAWGITKLQTLVGKPCMDSTHRVFHLSGSLGNAICQQFFQAGWITRNKENRSVCLTEEGQNELLKVGIDLQ